ncbi:UvrB/UvrC motif-containing protein [Patescibacteria group bacterium]|nr:UvrB/UvrC motif-containing protein [Patescibacteria group bacterium]
MSVERNYKEILNGRSSAVKKALAFGQGGNYDFHPATIEEKHAYQVGLGKWIMGKNLPGLDPSLFNNGSMWKGFCFEMIASGKFIFKDESPETDHKKLAHQKIGEILNGQITDEGVAKSASKDVPSFRDGIDLAIDYVNFINYWAPKIYEIDFDEISPENANDFFRIHRQIKQDIGDRHPVLGRMELFLDKNQHLEGNIDVLDCNQALDECDYLEILLLGIRAESLTNSVLTDDQGIRIVQDEIEAARVDSFDISSKLEDVQSSRQRILLRMENPVTYLLEEKLNAAVKEEEFEKAAYIRDYVSEIRQLDS